MVTNSRNHGLEQISFWQKRKLILAGIISPVVFWSTLIICGLIVEDYNHLKNLVSELGAIGTNTQYLFTLGMSLTSILSILFIYGLYKTGKREGVNIIPILFISTFSISLLGAAIFPMPLQLHGILGSPTMLLPLSPLFALIFWKNKQIPNVKLASGITLFIMLLGFLVFFENILENYMGLKQRIFHVSWTLWFIYLSRVFLRFENK